MQGLWCLFLEGRETSQYQKEPSVVLWLKDQEPPFRYWYLKENQKPLYERSLFWRAKHFQDNIRSYNNALSVAVPVAEYSRRTIRSGHVASFNGRVEYQCSTSVSNNLTASQLYFVNMSEEVITHRLRRTEAP